jgi:hypothetical protein
MEINWVGFAGSALAICIFLCPFAYKERRRQGGSHIRATLDALLMFGIVFLLISGGSITLYGTGIVIDTPAQPLGSGGYEPAETHMERIKIGYLLFGVGLIVAGCLIGKIMSFSDESFRIRKK